MRLVMFAIGIVLFATATAFAGPKIGVVVGPKAPKLEQLAAEELAAQLKELFEAEVAVVDNIPANVEHLILVGSPATNPAVAKAVGEKWPKLTEQGHLLRSVKLGDRDALVVGGGSPVATLWAAYELGHHFGIRSFLHGDVFPEKAPELKLTGIDAILEPTMKVRAWRVLDENPIGFGAWGIEDYKQLLGQLAKRKFNQIVIGIDSQNAPLPFGGRRFVVAGDTPGRKAFKGAKEFENPATAGKNSDADRKSAIGDLAKKLTNTAAELGITVGTPTPGTLEPLGVLPRGVVLSPEGGHTDSVRVLATPSNAEVFTFDISRRAFDAKLSSKKSLSDLFTPVLGPLSTERVVLGFDLIDQAAALIAKHDPKAIAVSPGSIAKQLKSADAPPEWWKEAGKLYAGAMNEMYRGIRATYNDAARPELLYHAKRCEFAVHYFAALESARLAGVANAKSEKETQVSQMEKATESLYNALTALGDVARDPTDRGVIAVLAEDDYRPLKNALKEAEKK